MAGVRVRLRRRPAGLAQVRHARPARHVRERRTLAAALWLLGLPGAQPGHGAVVMADTWNGLEAHMFGDGPELADELLALILAGRKTATCWSAAEGLKGAAVGKPWAVKDGAGVVRC